jgi:hypothetical protein
MSFFLKDKQARQWDKNDWGHLKDLRWEDWGGFELKNIPDEGRREFLLFGPPIRYTDDQGQPLSQEAIEKQHHDRRERRRELRQTLSAKGFEPLPVVNAPPYAAEPTGTVHEFYGYHPEFMAINGDRANPNNNVFGDVSPYKQYAMGADGQYNPLHPLTNTVWQGYAAKATELVRNLGFDFMRVDLAHLPYRWIPPANGKTVPENQEEFLAFVKRSVQEQAGKPYFAVLGEHFMDPADAQKYADYYHRAPIDWELDAARKGLDVVTGNLQYYYMDGMRGGDSEFARKAQEFATRFQRIQPESSPTRVVPASATTIATADSDNADTRDRYDIPAASTGRAFIGYMLNTPGYINAGFEERKPAPDDVHHPGKDGPEPDHFKHYAEYNIKRGETPYELGKNMDVFKPIQAIREQYVKLRDTIWNQDHWWLKHWDNTLAWMYYDAKDHKPSYIMAVNTDVTHDKPDLTIPNPLRQENNGKRVVQGDSITLNTTFRTDSHIRDATPITATEREDELHLGKFPAGSGRIYQVV